MSKSKFNPAIKSLSPLVGKAIGDYQMIKEGDRILVAVSGGKDSVLLLEMMRYFQQVAPVKFEIRPVFVDIGLPRFPLGRLKDFFKQTGLPYEIIEAKKIKEKSWDDIECYGCSRERRKLFFETADRLKFNKIALGHNQDDIAETILLNLFFRGEIGSMCPNQEFFKGRLHIIRPLAYVRAEEIRQMAVAGCFSTFKGNKCPNDHESQRMAIRRMLGKLEKVNPFLKKNIISALKNIRAEYLP
jgi:tRNA 2-thiocytidine biosynthesis protein TtcA